MVGEYSHQLRGTIAVAASRFRWGYRTSSDLERPGTLRSTASAETSALLLHARTGPRRNLLVFGRGLHDVIRTRLWESRVGTRPQGQRRWRAPVAVADCSRSHRNRMFGRRVRARLIISGSQCTREAG